MTYWFLMSVIMSQLADDENVAFPRILIVGLFSVKVFPLIVGAARSIVQPYEDVANVKLVAVDQ